MVLDITKVKGSQRMIVFTKNHTSVLTYSVTYGRENIKVSVAYLFMWSCTSQYLICTDDFFFSHFRSWSVAIATSRDRNADSSSLGHVFESLDSVRREGEGNTYTSTCETTVVLKRLEDWRVESVKVKMETIDLIMNLYELIIIFIIISNCP